MYRHILVALDGSENAEQILPHAIAIAQKFEARLTLLRADPPQTTEETTLAASQAAGTIPVGTTIAHPTPMVEDEAAVAGDYLSRLVTRLKGLGLQVEGVEAEGSAAEAIVEAARRLEVDLIAMTTHARGGLGRLFFGSVSEGVVHHAPCPMLVLRVAGG